MRDPHTGDPCFKMHFLSHLARLGRTNIHPLGSAATEYLIWALRLRPGLRVLEVGCGTAETLLRIASRYYVLADGVDVLPEMLRVARLRITVARMGRRVHLYQTTPGTPLPFANGTYDRAYTESVLGFQDEAGAKQMLSEIYRVLKVGSLYVANEAIWKKSTPEGVIARINEAAVADFGLRQAAEQPWGVDEWRALMVETGFEIVSTTNLDELAPRRRLRRRLPHPSLAASATLTRLYGLRGYVQPSLLREKLRYRRLLSEHAQDGEYIEARLFILRKPVRKSTGD